MCGESPRIVYQEKGSASNGVFSVSASFVHAAPISNPGIIADIGGEFSNEALIAYCVHEQRTFLEDALI